MMSRWSNACCVALVVVFAQATASANACEGADCRVSGQSAKPGTPLQLGAFMRAHKNKHVMTTKKRIGNDGAVTAARHRKPVSSPVTAQSEPATPATQLSDDAASAFATPTSNVRVVASDEFNEIDQAASLASIETTGVGVPTIAAAKPANVAQSVVPHTSALVIASDRSDPLMAGKPEPQFWIERLWARLQHTFVAVGAAVRYLIG